jgi:hypothetical protein
VVIIAVLLWLLSRFLLFVYSDPLFSLSFRFLLSFGFLRLFLFLTAF